MRIRVGDQASGMGEEAMPFQSDFSALQGLTLNRARRGELERVKAAIQSHRSLFKNWRNASPDRIRTGTGRREFENRGERFGKPSTWTARSLDKPRASGRRYPA